MAKKNSSDVEKEEVTAEKKVGDGLVSLDSVLTGLKKDFGEVLIDFTTTKKISRVSCSSPIIGEILGGGGWPVGVIIELFGMESAGKSSLCSLAGGDFQKAPDRNIVAYIDSEHAFDPEYAMKFGLDPYDKSKFRLFQPNSAEEAWEIAHRLTNVRGMGLIIEDSVASMIPQAELDGEISDNQIARLALTMGKAMRKMVPACKKNKVTLICINQIRMKTMVMHGNPECVTPETMIKIMM